MLTVRGASGELCVAARPVAVLGHWTLTCEGPTATLIGLVSSVEDAYLLEVCNRFELRLPAGRNVWRWPVVQVITDGENIAIQMEGAHECLRAAV